MGWWKYAYVGQKVVCISDAKDINPDFDHTPTVRKNDVATIEQIVVDEAMKSGVGLVFREDQGTPDFFAVYDPSNFRPLITKSTETGMKIIRSILDRAPVKEDA